MAQPYEKCFPTGESKPTALIGYGFVVVGVILLFCCIPCWAWVALIGVGLICLGALLLKISRAWR